jgi:hypothetical protein
MQDNAMQDALRPYVKLVQSNMELLGRFSMSPESMTQALAHAQSLFTPGRNAPPPQLAQSPAFAELVQGMIRNYTEFMAEVAQSSIELLTQGQATWIQQTRQATEGVAGAAGARASRVR